MADFRAIFGEDDSETEEFLGFDLDDIKEAEEKYVRQLNVLDDLDSDVKFSEMGSSDEEEIDSDDDTVLVDIAKWSDHLRPIQIAEFTGPTTVVENNKRELDFFNLLFPEALLIEIGTQLMQRKSRLLLVFKLSWVFYQSLPKTCTDSKTNCSIRRALK